MGVSDLQGREKFGALNPQLKQAIAYCSQTVSPILSRDKYKRAILLLAKLL